MCILKKTKMAGVDQPVLHVLQGVEVSATPSEVYEAFAKAKESNRWVCKTTKEVQQDYLELGEKHEATEIDDMQAIKTKNDIDLCCRRPKRI